jgi:hypothetical protein
MAGKIATSGIKLRKFCPLFYFAFYPDGHLFIKVPIKEEFLGIIVEKK